MSTDNSNWHQREHQELEERKRRLARLERDYRRWKRERKAEYLRLRRQPPGGGR